MFFFFKQKTAYEMRISDWSSDVCSSDLTSPHGVHAFEHGSVGASSRLGAPESPSGTVDAAVGVSLGGSCSGGDHGVKTSDFLTTSTSAVRVNPFSDQVLHGGLSHVYTAGQQVDHLLRAGVLEHLQTADDNRSEEHTSELQSLMRTSYAVFC